MKSIKKYTVFIFVCLTFILPACNEDKELKEVPLDFLSPENAYITKNDYNSLLNGIYWAARRNVWSNENNRFGMSYGNDVLMRGLDWNSASELNDYANVMNPSYGVPRDVWRFNYELIYSANAIISRIEYPACQVDAKDRPGIIAEAKFFRAYAYRYLAHLFGDVPLLEDEIVTPRRDYVRAPRADVYQFIVDDLLYSVTHLSDINQVKDGKVSKQLAYHLLSEIYISQGNYTAAIDAATQVINHPAMALMTDRFGNYKAYAEGNVYWDLFRNNNQNRSSGNTETLWCFQYDYGAPGTSAGANNSWAINPQYTNLSVDGKSLFPKYTAHKGGNNLGWMRVTPYFCYGLWSRVGPDDLRNDECNIIRDAQVENPDSPLFGQWLVKDNILEDHKLDTILNWHPILTKVILIYGYPNSMYDVWDKDNVKSPFGDDVVTNSSSNVRADDYIFRLAETYLLRAEAHLLNGDPTAATVDVNAVRNRAKAIPATVEEMNIDYILDERMRELVMEEFRTVTLCRMGLHYERTKKYNPKSGLSIQPHHNLWPVPYDEILNNVYAELKQNPGYTN